MGIIECKGVCKSFGEKVALDNVSVDIPKGKIFGLLGPNGAGKTTLIRIINRITIPNQGTVLFNGKPITQDDVAKIGYLPEERGLYRKMKVGEQAMYFAQLKGMSHHEAMAALKDWFVRFGIESWWNKKVEELSKGMAQKIQFITTVVHKPSLLILEASLEMNSFCFSVIGTWRGFGCSNSCLALSMVAVCSGLIGSWKATTSSSLFI